MDDSYQRIHFERLYQKVFHCSIEEYEEKEKNQSEEKKGKSED